MCRDSTKRLLSPCQGMRGAGAEHGPAGPSSGATLCPLPQPPHARLGKGAVPFVPGCSAEVWRAIPLDRRVGSRSLLCLA